MPRKGCKNEGCNGCDKSKCPGPRNCTPYRTASSEAKRRRDGCKVVGCKHEGKVKGCTPDNCPGTKNCVAYGRAKVKDYNIAHPEYKPNYGKNYYRNNKEHVLAKVAAYNEANSEAIKAYQRQYHKDNYNYIGDFKALMHEDGSVTRMRSMSEVYFFSMLEEEGMEYNYEVRLETPMGVYVADGYIPELNIYVEVKADYYVRDDQMAKIEYLREQGYSIIMIDADLINDEFGF
jgi:very-short-patch-repair endonuclease